MKHASINLLSGSYRQKRAYRRYAGAWCCIGAAYAALSIGAAGAFYVMGNSGHERTAADLAHLESRIAKERDAIVAIRNESEGIDRKVAVTQAVIDRPDWSVLMQALASCLSEEVTLNEVRVEPAPAEVKGTDQAMLSVRRARVIVNAIARSQQDVSDFALRLEKLGLFNAVQMLRSGRADSGSGRGINVELECSIDESGSPR